MRIHIVGKEGLRKPNFAEWVAERYGLRPCDVVAVSSSAIGADLTIEVFGPFDEAAFRMNPPERTVYAWLPEEFLGTRGVMPSSAKRVLDEKLGHALDFVLRPFGFRSGSSVVAAYVGSSGPASEPQAGERWMNVHTGEIATVVRIDEVQARPTVHRVVVYTEPGSTEEKRCNLHPYKREYVSRALIELFGPEEAAKVDGWHEHWELVIENHAPTGAAFDLTVRPGIPRPEEKNREQKKGV